MRRWEPLTLVAMLAVSTPVLAQTHDTTTIGSDCAPCHTPHAAAPGPYLLVPGDGGAGGDGGGGGSAASLASVVDPALSRTTLSCLRCHSTPALRDAARQPNSRIGPEISPRSYLGDLNDDHPLARGDARGVVRPPPRRVGIALRSRVRSSVAITPRGGLRLPECTTCHDVHSRNQLIPEADAQRAMCLDCHDAAKYGVQNHNSLACEECHDLHGGSEASLLAERNPEVLCTSCHDPSAASFSLREGRTTVLRGPPGHPQRPPGRSCLSCHAAHR